MRWASIDDYPLHICPICHIKPLLLHQAERDGNPLLTDASPQFKAAQYLRLAEERGSKTVGNSW